MTRIDRRAAAKTFTWRVVATATTITVAFIFTGSIEISFGIGVFEALLKMLFYYMHEKAWDKLSIFSDEEP